MGAGALSDLHIRWLDKYSPFTLRNARSPLRINGQRAFLRVGNIEVLEVSVLIPDSSLVVSGQFAVKVIDVS